MISCNICNQKFKQLQSHLRTHNITVGQYRIMFPNAPLMSEEQRDKISDRMKNGQSRQMQQKAKGCKKPNLSKLMKGNKRGLGSDRSGERQRYVEQAKKQHLENNFGSWSDERRKWQSEYTKGMWRSGTLTHNWKPRWEIELADYFIKNNINFIPQFIIPEDRIQNGYRLTKPFDFYLPNYNLLIELQGCFWHGCKECYSFHPIQDRVMKNDIEKEKIAISCGFTLLKIWEHDKKRLYEIVEEQIKKPMNPIKGNSSASERLIPIILH